MMELTKERLMALSNRENVGAICSDEIAEMARQLLAGLEQEPVADVVAWHHPTEERNCDIRLRRHDLAPGPLYAAPQLPQPAVGDGRDQFEEWFKFHHGDEHSIVKLHRANGGANYRDPHVDLAWIAWKDSRAAMLQGAEPVSQPYTLPTKCWCHTCRPVTMNDARFVVCPDCGNKRCPRANDHRNACTGSNEPGQEGSAYPAAPQQEADNG